jgi:hypothetical protein
VWVSAGAPAGTGVATNQGGPGRPLQVQVQDRRDILSALDIPPDRDSRHVLDIPRRRRGPGKCSRPSQAR